MTTDRISDTLVRIKNALKIKNKFVLIPYTKLNLQLLNLLKHEQLILNFELIHYEKKDYLNVFLKYELIKNSKISLIKNLTRFSKPSLRVYIKLNSIKKLFNRREIYFISTSKGIMNYVDAYKNGLGGELLFSIS